MTGFNLAKTSAIDRVAKTLVVNFYSANGESQYPTASRFCAAVVKSHGSNPSYGMCGSPVADAIGPGKWDKFAGAVALKNSVAKDVKLLSRASCGYSENGKSITLLNGWVVSHGHNLREDSIVSQVFDDRHIMASYYTLFGKMCWDPTQSKHYFVSNPNDPLIFNKDGHGDCLDSPFGPRFSTGHRRGHSGNNTTDASDNPAPGYATEKTRKWTVKDILRYLRDFLYEISNRPPLIPKFGLMEMPKKFLDWPASLGANIVENKTPHSFRLQGANLLEGIVKTLSYAGPYELNLEPVNNTKSILQVIDFSKRANSGMKIFGPDYFGNDLASVGDNPNVAIDGHIKQSALGFAQNVVNTGDAPFIEFMASTDPADSDCFAASLSYGHDAAELALFKSRVSQGPGVNPYEGDAQYFTFASKETPSVFSYFKLNSAKNPFGLSKYAGRDESGNYRLLPHQLTSYNNNAASPLGLVPREIVVEVKMTDWEYESYLELSEPDGGYRDQWRVASRYSELQLSPCGRYIQLPGLRDQVGVDNGSTWYSEDIIDDANEASTYSGNFMAPRHVRIQVVAQSDHCITSVRGDKDDPNNTAAHIDSGAPKFSLLLLNEPMQYVDWLRRNQSYPIGIGGFPSGIKNPLILQFQPKQAAGSELFTDHVGDGDITNPKNRLDSHCQKFVDNHKRIMFEGWFLIGRLTPLFKIGQLVTYEASNALPGVTGVIKCIVFDANKQNVKVEIGPPSFSTIWDGPIQQYQGGGGTGVPPESTTAPETKSPTPATPSTSTSGTPTTTPASTSGGKSVSTSGESKKAAPPEVTSYNEEQGKKAAGGAGGGPMTDAEIAAQKKNQPMAGDKQTAEKRAPQAGDDDDPEFKEEVEAESRRKQYKSEDAAAKSQQAAPKGKSQILQGEALEKKDEARKTFGDSEKGIMSPDATKAKDDEMKARYYGKGQEGRSYEERQKDENKNEPGREVQSVSGDQGPAAAQRAADKPMNASQTPLDEGAGYTDRAKQQYAASKGIDLQGKRGEIKRGDEKRAGYEKATADLRKKEAERETARAEEKRARGW